MAWLDTEHLKPAFSWKKRPSVRLLIAPAGRCVSLRLTNGSFHSTQAEKQELAHRFHQQASPADDVRKTPLTAFTDAHKDSQAARSRDCVDHVSQIVSKRVRGLSHTPNKCY